LLRDQIEARLRASAEREVLHGLLHESASLSEFRRCSSRIGRTGSRSRARKPSGTFGFLHSLTDEMQESTLAQVLPVRLVPLYIGCSGELFRGNFTPKDSWGDPGARSTSPYSGPTTSTLSPPRIPRRPKKKLKLKPELRRNLVAPLLGTISA
jgi:hypothetical protein